MTRKNSISKAAFANARPLVGEMRTVIRRSIAVNPEVDAAVIVPALFARFVQEGLVEQAEWAEDLIYSMALTEVDALWAKAEVV